MEISVAYFSEKEQCLLFKEKGSNKGIGFIVYDLVDVEETVIYHLPKIKRGEKYITYSYELRKKSANDWVRIKLP